MNMKQVRWLIVMAAMLFATAGAANAADIKVKGEWDFAFGWAVNQNFHGGRDSKLSIPGLNVNYPDNDNFYARQRVRTQINFIASEQLQAVLMFEIGDLNWGRDEGGKFGQGSGGGLDADGVNVETKRAYLDWVIPETDVTVRMGIQGVSLPMANGYSNPVFSADVAGILVSSPITDMIGITAFWLRPFDRYETDDTSIAGNLDDEMDMFGLVLPITGDAWSVTPWGMYARIGNFSEYYDYYGLITSAGREPGDGTNAWWAGVSVQVDVLDPLSFGFDIMYGHMSKADVGLFNPAAPSNPAYGRVSDFGTRGWFLEAALNYKLDWGTPGIFGWYATGDDCDDVKDGQFGRMPVVGTDDGFGPTSFGFPGSYGIGADSLIGTTGVGTWGIGVQIADMSFVENLSHTLRLAYYRGTNDADLARKDGGVDPWNTDLPGVLDSAIYHSGGESMYLTNKDYAWEVNFDHQYKITENLTTVLELGYINLNLDEDTWLDHNTDDAWKAQLLFRYSF